MAKMKTKNKIKIAKIAKNKNKKKKIIKSYKLILKKCFLKNFLLKGKNRFKDMWFKENKIENI